MTYWEVILLLALNCWHECPSEPVQGQIAVAQVLINRTRQCGSTVSVELFRAKQFSWTNDKGRNLILRQRNDDDYSKFSQCLAVAALAYAAPDLTGGANHYHADYIPAPYWARGMTETAHIGAHVFYRGDLSCSVQPPARGTEQENDRTAVTPVLLSGIDAAAITGDVIAAVIAATQSATTSSNTCLLTIATSSPSSGQTAACPEEGMVDDAGQARGPP